MAGAQRPPQQAPHRGHDVRTSNSAVWAASLDDVGVDPRRVQSGPVQIPVSGGQPVQQASGVAHTCRDGLLGEAAVVAHPRTPPGHRHLSRRRPAALDHHRAQIAARPEEPAHRPRRSHRGDAHDLPRALRGDEPAEELPIDVVHPGADHVHPRAEPLQQVHDPGRRTRRVALRGQPSRALTQHRRCQRAHRNPRDPNRIRPGRRRSLRHGPHLQTLRAWKRDHDYATMPTFRTSAAAMTSTNAGMIGVVRRSA